MNLETRVSKLEQAQSFEDRPFRAFIRLVESRKEPIGWRLGKEVFFIEPGESDEALMDRIASSVDETGIILMHPLY